MPLLPPQAYADIFDRLRDHRIGYVELPGNVGDRMIRLATRQLLRYFGISYRLLGRREIAGKREPGETVDRILISGGGNLGTLYPECRRLREKVLALGPPVTVLPQSIYGNPEDLGSYERVYVRERSSLEFPGEVVLAPDLALALDHVNAESVPVLERGVFLRRDVEKLLAPDSRSLCDPADVCHTVEEYLELASLCGAIYTDRLHFAIAGLLLGRDVTLLPNSYDKNRAMFETWLKDLGCSWRDDLQGVQIDRERATDLVWRRLSGSPARLLPWAAQPRQVDGHSWTETAERHELRNAAGKQVVCCDDASRVVWDLCDGRRSMDQVAALIGDRYPHRRIEVAADVQTIVRRFIRAGAISCQQGEGPRIKGPGGPPRGGSMRVTVLPDLDAGGWTYRRAGISFRDAPERELWFAVPTEHRPCLADNANAFVVAVLMDAMCRGRRIELEGAAVTESLLRNLDEFQRAWVAWRSNLNIIPIDAESVGDETSSGKPAVMSFSGGLDSCYTLMQNRPQSDSVRRIDVGAALMLHGYDIPLVDRAGFAGAWERGRVICESAGVELIPMRTNFRRLHAPRYWEDRHGTALAAALTLLAGRFGAGVVSATLPYQIMASWGSNPVTDPLLGSGGFPVLHFGAGATRLEKFRAVGQWDEARRRLRVCWEGRDRRGNCGRCRKCVLTQVSLKCLGLPLDCFSAPLEDAALAERLPTRYPGHMDLFDIRQLLQAAKDQGIEMPWVDKLDEVFGRQNG